MSVSDNIVYIESSAYTPVFSEECVNAVFDFIVEHWIGTIHVPVFCRHSINFLWWGLQRKDLETVPIYTSYDLKNQIRISSCDLEKLKDIQERYPDTVEKKDIIVAGHSHKEDLEDVISRIAIGEEVLSFILRSKRLFYLSKKHMFKEQDYLQLCQYLECYAILDAGGSLEIRYGKD